MILSRLLRSCVGQGGTKVVGRRLSSNRLAAYRKTIQIRDYSRFEFDSAGSGRGAENVPLKLTRLLKNRDYSTAVELARQHLQSAWSLSTQTLSLLLQVASSQGIDKLRVQIRGLQEKMAESLAPIDDSLWTLPDILEIATNGDVEKLEKLWIELFNSEAITSSTNPEAHLIDAAIRCSIHCVEIDAAHVLLNSVYNALRKVRETYPSLAESIISPSAVQMFSNHAYRLHRPDVVISAVLGAEELGIQPTGPMYFHFLAAKCMKLELEQALGILKNLVKHNVALESATLRLVLTACISGSRLDVGEAIFHFWKSHKLPLETKAHNAYLQLIYSYGTSSKVESLWKERSVTKDRFEKLDAEAYNIHSPFFSRRPERIQVFSLTSSSKYCSGE